MNYTLKHRTVLVIR